MGWTTQLLVTLTGISIAAAAVTVTIPIETVTAEVTENSAAGTWEYTVFVQADALPEFEIVQNPVSPAFTGTRTDELNEGGEYEFKITSPVLDYESVSSVKINVRITDPSDNDTALTKDIVVNVLDVNDNAPDLDLPASAEFFITDAPGTVIATATAPDGDGTAPNNEVTFEIKDGNDGGVFEINSTTGEITLASQTEIQAVLTIRATDGGDPPQFNEKTISINSAVPARCDDDHGHGDTYTDDCNTCTCINGNFRCTEIDCAAARCDDDHGHGDTYMDDCNTCTCVNGTFICTEIDCGNSSCMESGKEYHHGDYYMDDCNRCTCDNGNFSCTEMACNASCMESEKEYHHGDYYMDDCNRCTCDNGNFSCTEMACGPASCMGPDREYNHGETFMDDCNTCRCMDGNIACTKMACECVIDLFRECFAGAFNVAFSIIVSDDRKELCSVRHDIELCVESQLHLCYDHIGNVMSEVVRPYPAILKHITQTVCSADFEIGRPSEGCDLVTAGSCFQDFAKVAAHGMLTGTCLQAKASMTCIKKVTDHCYGVHQNLLSMLINTMTVTTKTMCNPEKCSLGMAEQCIKEAKMVVGYPIYRDGSLLTCRWLKKTLTCAASHTVSFSQNSEDWVEEWEQMMDESEEKDSEMKGSGSIRTDEGSSREMSYSDLDRSSRTGSSGSRNVGSKSGSRSRSETRSEFLRFVGALKDELPSWDSMEDIRSGSEDMGTGGSYSEVSGKTESGERSSQLNMFVRAALDGLKDLRMRIHMEDDSEYETENEESMAENIGRLYEQLEELREELSSDDSDIDLHEVSARLQHIREEIEAVLQEYGDGTLPEDLEILRTTVEAEVEQHIGALRERFAAVREDLMDLHFQAKMMCESEEDGYQDNKEDKEKPGLVLLKMLGSLMANPFSSKEQMCMIIQSIEMSLDDMSQWNSGKDHDYAVMMYRSVRYGHKALGCGMEREEEEEDEREKEGDDMEDDCITAEQAVERAEAALVCDIEAALQCESDASGILGTLFRLIQMGSEFADICRYAQDKLHCVESNMTVCQQSDIDPYLQEIQPIVPGIEALIGRHSEACDLRPKPEPEKPICEEKPTCQPYANLTECFSDTVDTANVSRHVGEIIKCVKKYSACSHSYEVVPLQVTINKYVMENMVNLSALEIDVNILPYDDFFPLSTCYLESAGRIKEIVMSTNSMNEAYCTAIVEFDFCIKQQKMQPPFLLTYMMSQLDGFYENFMRESCRDLDWDELLGRKKDDYEMGYPTETTDGMETEKPTEPDEEPQTPEGDEEPSKPDFQACVGMDAALQCYMSYILEIDNVLAFHAGTTRYARICSEDRLEAVRECVAAAVPVENCPADAMYRIVDGMEFLTKLRYAKCSVHIPIPDMCDTTGMEMCLKGFGEYLALASDAVDSRSKKLGQTVACVQKLSASCKEDNELVIKDYFMQELKNTEIFLSASLDSLPDWCPVVDRTEEPEGTDNSTLKCPEKYYDPDSPGEYCGTTCGEGMEPCGEEQMCCDDECGTMSCMDPIRAGEPSQPMEDSYLPFCEGSLRSCTLDWSVCLPQDTDVCTNATDTARCIDNLTADCKDFQLHALRENILLYIQTFQPNALDCNIIPDRFFSIETHPDLNQCLSGVPSLEVNKREGFCNGIRVFSECFDKTAASADSGVLVGMLKIAKQVQDNFREKHCPDTATNQTDDGSDMGTLECPASTFDPDNPGAECPDLCTDDTPCAEGKMCCENECGTTSCMDPVAGEPEEGPPEELAGMKNHLSLLFYMSMTLNLYPVSDRQQLCSLGIMHYYMIDNFLQTCDHSECYEMKKSLHLIGYYSDFVGICTKEPILRECDAHAALECTANQVISILHHIGQENECAICSQNIMIQRCVSVKTSLCNPIKKALVEKTYGVVDMVVNHLCAPPPPPEEPEVMCLMPGERPNCNVDEAMSALIPLHAKMTMDKPDWGYICSSFPVMRTVIERQVSGCSQTRLDVFSKVKAKLMGKVAEKCPQVHCDICGAHRCLDKAYSTMGSSKFCQSVFEVSDCVAMHSYGCDEKHLADVHMKLRHLSKYAHPMCENKMHDCLMTFKQAVFDIHLYHGDRLLVEEESESRASSKSRGSQETRSSRGSPDTGRSSDSRGTSNTGWSSDSMGTSQSYGKSQESQGSDGEECDEYYYPDEPWYSKDLDNLLVSLIRGDSERDDDDDYMRGYGDDEEEEKYDDEYEGESDSENESGSTDYSRSTGSTGSRSTGSTGSRSAGSTGSGSTGSTGSGSGSTGSTGSGSTGSTGSGSAGSTGSGSGSGSAGSTGSGSSGSTGSGSAGSTGSRSAGSTGSGSTGSTGSGSGSTGSTGSGSTGSTGSGSAGSTGSGSTGSTGSGSTGSTGSGSTGSTGSGSAGSTGSGSTGSTGSGSTGSTGSGSAGSTGSRSTGSTGSGSTGSTGSGSAGSTGSGSTGKSTGKSGSGMTGKSRSGSSGKSKKRCERQRPAPLHPDLKSICTELFLSFECIRDHLFLLDVRVRDTVKLTLVSMLQVARQKCQVPELQCHKCHKAHSHEECNKMPAETCAHNLQMCQTIEVSGKKTYVSKGCVNPRSCKVGYNGNGMRYESCCDTPLCNKVPDQPKCSNGNMPLKDDTTGEDLYCGRGGNECPAGSTCSVHPTDRWAICCPDDEKPKCEIFSGTVCACLLVEQLITDGEINCRMYEQSVECMSRYSERCTSKEEFGIMSMYSHYMMRGHAWSYCKQQERSCDCGLYGALSLTYALGSPYISESTACRHLHSSYEIVKEASMSGHCSAEEISSVMLKLKLARTALGDMCVEEPPTPVEVCPVMTADDLGNCTQYTSCDDYYLHCETGGCCQYRECGEVCMPLIVVDPTPRDGKCPDFGDAVADCAPELFSECSYDAQCDSGMKCCADLCGQMMCMPMEDPRPHKGMCPRVEPLPEGMVCESISDCTFDSDCDEGQKCCLDQCGVMVCQSPQDPTPRPGDCPKPENDTFGACAELCSYDSECDNHGKCCSNGCGHTCMMPESKPGQCPPVKPFEGDKCASNCSIDGECDGEKKCCSVGCGLACLDPFIKYECKEGVPMAACSAAPCDVTTCPAYPDAVCQANYCAGCNAQFYLHGVDVTTQCEQPWLEDKCNSDPLGPCGENDTVSWYFNSETHDCDSGCLVEESGMYYESYDACISACSRMAMCYVPYEETHLCTGEIPAWYFDSESCQPTVFSGCAGSRNRFNTELECQLRCTSDELNEECSRVRERLADLMAKALTILSLASDRSMACRTLDSGILKQIMQGIGQCRDPDLHAEIVVEVQVFLNETNCRKDKEMTGSDDEDEGGTEPDEEEQPSMDLTCESNQVIYSQCIESEETELACEQIQEKAQCVANMSSGCNKVSMIPVSKHLDGFWSALAEPDTCDLGIGSHPDDVLLPIVHCIKEFLADFSEGLEASYLPTGDTDTICSAAMEMRNCVVSIDNLPVKSRAHGIMWFVSKVQEKFCLTVDPDREVDWLQCHSCYGEEDNEACNNQTVESCRFDQDVCAAHIKSVDGKRMISKGCASFSTAYESLFVLDEYVTEYWYQCSGSLCNVGLDKPEVEGEPGDEIPTDGDDTPTDPDTDPGSCEISVIRELASEYFERIIILGFSHYQDYHAFCSQKAAELSGAVKSMRDGCSESKIKRIDTIMSCFDDITTNVCPQEIPGPPCDEWKECVPGLVTYGRSIHNETICPFLQDSLNCIRGKLEKCTLEERRPASRSSLQFLTYVLQDDPCEFALEEIICNVEEVECGPDGTEEPVCSVAQAFNLSSVFIQNAGNLSNPSEICQLASVDNSNIAADIRDCNNAGLHLSKAVLGTAHNVFGCQESVAFEITPVDGLAQFGTCVSTFLSTMMSDVFNVDPLVDIQVVCDTLMTLTNCTDEIDSYMAASLMSEHIDLAKKWMTETDVCNAGSVPGHVNTNTEDCQVKKAGQCLMSKLSMLYVAPLLNMADKEFICNSELDDCFSYIGNCPPRVETGMPEVQELFRMLLGVFEYSKFRTSVCEIPSPPEPQPEHEPEEPKPEPEEPSPESEEPKVSKCEPDRALTCISEMGMSISQCIHSDSLRYKVCSSVEVIELCVRTSVAVCPEGIVESVMNSWYSLYYLVSRVCGYTDYPLPFPGRPTPDCIVRGAPIMHGACEPISLMYCKRELEREIFNEFGTEERLEAVTKKAVQCFMENTVNCIPGVAQAVGRFVEGVVAPLTARFDIWCEVEPPKICYLEDAWHCVETYKYMLEERNKKVCSMAEKMQECIMKTTLECDDTDKLLIQETFRSLYSHSVILCEDKDSKEDSEELEECLVALKDKAWMLLMYVGPDYDSVSDDEDSGTISGSAGSDMSSGSTDRDTASGSPGGRTASSSQGSDTASGTAGSTRSGRKGGSPGSGNAGGTPGSGNTGGTSGSGNTGSGNAGGTPGSGNTGVNTSGNTGSGTPGSGNTGGTPGSGNTGGTPGSGSTGGDTASGTSGNDRQGKSESMNRGPWDRSISRDFKDTVMNLCDEVFELWKCVEDSLEMMHPEKMQIVQLILKAVKQAVNEKCQPRHCHSCMKLGDNDLCNAQQTCVCPTDKQMCISSYERGVYTKSCAGERECAECMGKENCYCCHGHECNKPGVIDTDKHCAVDMAIQCAFRLMQTIKVTDTLSYSVAEADLTCMLNYTAGCTAYSFMSIHSITLEIIQLFRIQSCVSQYGDAYCGTAGFLSMGYLMFNPLITREHLCWQYEATTELKIEVENSGVCVDGLGLLQESYNIATKKLQGVCFVPETPPPVCNVELVRSSCLMAKDWLIAEEQACSEGMVNAFKTCVIENIAGCDSLESSSLFLPVMAHLQNADADCLIEDVSMNISALLVDIFPIDNFWMVRETFVQFTQGIYSSMLASSNFLADMCENLEKLKSDSESLELSALQKLEVVSVIDELSKLLGDRCEDTSVKEKEVLEECSSSVIDVVMVLDESGSVGDENFVKIKSFATKLVEMTSIENGNVRIGVVKYSTSVNTIFTLNDNLTKEEMVQTIDAIVYEKGYTNTAAGINTAAKMLIDEGRNEALHQIIVVTDGKYSEQRGYDNPQGAANSARQNGIRVSAVGINMEDEEQWEELRNIADDPDRLNVYRVDFTSLTKIIEEVFIVICRATDVSECEYDDLVVNVCSSMMSSLTSKHIAIDDQGSFCRSVESVSQEVTSLSVNCSRHERDVLQFVQSITVAESQQMCVHFREETDDDSGCDVDSARNIIADAAQYLACGTQGEDEILCMKIDVMLTSLDYKLKSCDAASYTVLASDLDFIHSVVLDRCPDLGWRLSCWFDDQMEEQSEILEEKENEVLCNPFSIIEGCVGDEPIDFSSLLMIDNICSNDGGLQEQRRTFSTCVVDTFVQNSCIVELFAELEEMAYGKVTPPLLENFIPDTCKDQFQISFELPQDYGWVPPRSCEAPLACDVQAAVDCVMTLDVPADSHCGNWTDVYECIEPKIDGCNSIDRFSVMSQIRYMPAVMDLPEDCLQGVVWTTAGDAYLSCLTTLDKDIEAVFKDSQGTVCQAYMDYMMCVNTAFSDSPLLLNLYVNAISTELTAFCAADGGDGEQTTDEEGEEEGEVEGEMEECDLDLALTCLRKFRNQALTGPALSMSLKTSLCAGFGEDLDCITTCSPAMYEKLWLAHHFAEAILFGSRVCDPEPMLCSTTDASYCITRLSRAVTSFNRLEGDSDKICHDIEFTRRCLKVTLSSCPWADQHSLVTTYEDVECLALDICPSAKPEPEEEPDKEPLECVDPNDFDDDDTTACDPVASFMCVTDFLKTANYVFRISDKGRCPAYSDMLTCAYKNVYECDNLKKGIVQAVLDKAKYFAAGCPTIVRSPCQEVDKCEEGLVKATACLIELKVTIAEEGDFCSAIDLTRKCLDQQLEECSDAASGPVWSEFNELREKVLPSCEDSFQTCAQKYVTAVDNILMWAVETEAIANAESESQESDVSSQDTDTPSTETKSSKTKSSKTKSSKTKSSKTKSSKKSSEGTASAGTANSGTADSGTASTGTAGSGTASTGTAGSGTASTGTAGSGTASTGTAGSGTASTGTAGSGTASTGTAGSGTASTGTAGSGTASTGTASTGTAGSGTASTGTASTGTAGSGTASTGTAGTGTASTGTASTGTASRESVDSGTVSDGIDSENLWEEREKELQNLCDLFLSAWECVSQNFDGVNSVVELTFREYYYTIKDICDAPKPGYCPVDETTDCTEIKAACAHDNQCQNDLKCCRSSCNMVCLPPEQEDPVCLTKFHFSTRLTFQLIAYLYPDMDGGRDAFCSAYIATSAELQTEIEICTDGRKTVIQNVMAACSVSYNEICTVEPPTCFKDDAVLCITDFETLKNDPETIMNDLCQEYEIVKQCVHVNIESCPEEDVIEVQALLKAAETSLQCIQLPEIECTVSDKKAIVLHEGDTAPMELGLKLLEAPSTVCPTGNNCKVVFEYSIKEKSDRPSCSNEKLIEQFIVGKFCNMEVDDSNFNETKTFNLRARMDGKIDGDFKAKLTVTAVLFSGGVELLRSDLCKYTVVVVDQDHTAMCKSVNDPHMTTFDGLSYDMMYEGEVLLYKHKVFTYLEVRAWYKPCKGNSKGGPTCNCGVAIKCGDDVISINRCVKKKNPLYGLQIINNGGLLPGCKVFTAQKGRQTIVMLPTGTQVTVWSNRGKGARKLVNIFITPSAADWLNTEGLCGMYNGDTEDDLMDKNGKQHDVSSYKKNKRGRITPNEFSETFRTLEKSDYFTRGVPAEEVTDLDNICSCNGDPEAVCDVIETCEIEGTDITTDLMEDAAINKKRRRKKRAVGDPIDDMGFDPTAVPDTTPLDFPTLSGITEDQANQACFNALSGASFSKECQTVPKDDTIIDCVTDILLLDDLETDFIKAQVDSFFEQCLNDKQTSTNATDINNLRNVSCPNSCSSRGTCDNGTCVCETNYAGFECEISINDPPILEALDDNLCTSTIASACESVLVLGEDFVEVDTLSCHLEFMEVTETGLGSVLEVQTVPAIFRSYEEVRCMLPAKNNVQAIKVSVSNNGQVASQSAQQLFLAHNPICWTCSADSITGTCRREMASCIIDDVCYRPLDQKPNDECYVCNVFTGNWTYHVSANCPETTPATTTETVTTVKLPRGDSDDKLVIGLSAGIAGAVLLAIVIALSVVAVRMHHNKMDKERMLERDSNSSNSRNRRPKITMREDAYYPGVSNYAYYYPAIMEAPQDSFTNGNLPVRNSHGRPDRTSRIDYYEQAGDNYA